MVATVDEADYELVSKYKWSASTGSRTIYAVTHIRHPSQDRIASGRYRRTPLYMHRLILGLEYGDKRLADHRDGNGLNNQRANLRVATHAENMANRQSAQDSSSKYIGVNFHRQTNRWHARIQKDKRRLHLGYFDTEEEAHTAYVQAATELHGAFTRETA